MLMTDAADVEITVALKDIAKQLAIANRLKILELRDQPTTGSKLRKLDDLEADIDM